MNRENRRWYKFTAVILVLALLIPVLAACGQAGAPTTGEPVPGAEIYIELEGNDDSTVTRSSMGPIFFGSKTAKNPLKTNTLYGKPVSGAQVIVNLTASNTQVAQCVTDENGEFTFDIDAVFRGKAIPEKIKVDLIITASSAFELVVDATNQITVEVEKSSGPAYTFILWWLTDTSKGQNKGCFAVSGKSST